MWASVSEGPGFGAHEHPIHARSSSSTPATQAQVWGEELDDPFLGPRIALAAEDAMKSIQVPGQKGLAARYIVGR